MNVLKYKSLYIKLIFLPRSILQKSNYSKLIFVTAELNCR